MSHHKPKTSGSTVDDLPCSIMDIVAYEHSKVKVLYTQLQAATDVGVRQMLCWELIRDICNHSAKEEMVLYPAMAAALGVDQAEHCLQEHQAVKTLLAQVDAMKVSDKGAMDMFDKAMQELLAHMEEEEQQFLPKFVEAVKNDQHYLKELGCQFHCATSNAPTRPHPDAANKPPENFMENPKLLLADLQMDLERFGGMAHTSAAKVVAA